MGFPKEIPSPFRWPTVYRWAAGLAEPPSEGFVLPSVKDEVAAFWNMEAGKIFVFQGNPFLLKHGPPLFPIPGKHAPLLLLRGKGEEGFQVVHGRPLGVQAVHALHHGKGSGRHLGFAADG